jgi:uncharacterized membrane protein YtjA (UPF0391 family)
MAASKAQGRSFAVFLLGCVVACAGLASWSGGSGKVLFIVGFVLMVVSLVMALGIKSLEGKVAQRAGNEAAKITGALLALLGWVVTVVGIQFVTGNGGRIVLALVGIATSLFGIVVVLPAAINKNAIWKA